MAKARYIYYRERFLVRRHKVFSRPARQWVKLGPVQGALGEFSTHTRFPEGVDVIKHALPGPLLGIHGKIGSDLVCHLYEFLGLHASSVLVPIETLLPREHGERVGARQ